MRQNVTIYHGTTFQELKDIYVICMGIINKSTWISDKMTIYEAIMIASYKLLSQKYKLTVTDYLWLLSHISVGLKL